MALWKRAGATVWQATPLPEKQPARPDRVPCRAVAAAMTVSNGSDAILGPLSDPSLSPSKSNRPAANVAAFFTAGSET